MEEMVTVYLLGKKYSVPATLTIMDAMEYAGFKLVRGCGCRSGFCGACAVIYRLKGSTELKVVLSCQTKVEEGMCVGKIDSFPINKRTFNIEGLSAGPECYAVYCLRSARRIRKSSACFLRLRWLQHLRIPLPGANQPQRCRPAVPSPDRQIYCTEVRASG